MDRQSTRVNLGGVSVFSAEASAIVREWWPDGLTQSFPDQELEKLIDDTEASIVDGDEYPLERLFEKIRSPRPTTVCNPKKEDLASHSQLLFLHDYWEARRDGKDLPLSSTIDAIDLVPAMGYMMLLEPVNQGEDFIYRVYGTQIARHSRVEMTGRRVRDIPVALVAVYFLATYRAAQRMRQPIFAHHATHSSIQVAEWDRLILPFANQEGIVDRLLVGNIPNVR